MAFLCIICGLLLLVRVNCNPLTEAITSTDPEVITSTDSEVIINTDSDVIKELEEVPETTTLINSKDIEIFETTLIGEEKTTVSDLTPNPSNNDCSECIETKFLNYYFSKGCKPIPHSNGCDNCPKKFDCNHINRTINYGNNECVYNGIKYKIGESIPVPNPCQVCQCGYGFDSSYYSRERISPMTTIHCITVECPEHFAVHSHPVQGVESDFEKVKNCYNTYENGKCCAVKKECPDSEQLLNSSVCLYNDKNYRIGEKIYPLEDRCKVCICGENWDPSDPTHNSGCYDVKCNLEIDHQFQEGCIPIYHEKTCCPIEYYCPEREDPEYERRQKCSEPSDPGPCLGVSKRFYYDNRDGQCHSFVYGGCGGNENNYRDLEDCEQMCIKDNEKSSENLSLNSTVDNEDYCLLNGNKYSIGHQLDIGQKCVDCECRIPPDFTCIHRSCPPPPNTKCKITYQESSCCPVFDCSYSEKITDRSFDPQSCPTPMCAEGCHFETYPDRCPGCVCELFVEMHKIHDHEGHDDVINV